MSTLDLMLEPPAVTKLTGTVLDGRYRLDDVLGTGGMGAVFEGEDLRLDRRVAIKIIRPVFAGHQEYIKRFLREAQSASKVRHRNVVVILDYGKTKGGLVYTVMELLEGEDLEQILSRPSARRLPWDQACELLFQIASGLKAAHERGMIHRDIKPANCMVTKEDEEWVVKLVDFGIAKPEDPSQSQRLTGASEVLGTPSYIAPEVVQTKKPATVRSDVYSLGVVAYRMLTGRLPFTGETAFEVLRQACMDPVPPLREHVADLPEPLEQLVLDMVAKEPEQRPADMQAVRQRLRALNREVAWTQAINFPVSSAIELIPSGEIDTRDGGAEVLGAEGRTAVVARAKSEVVRQPAVVDGKSALVEAETARKSGPAKSATSLDEAVLLRPAPMEESEPVEEPGSAKDEAPVEETAPLGPAPVEEDFVDEPESSVVRGTVRVKSAAGGFDSAVPASTEAPAIRRLGIPTPVHDPTSGSSRLGETLPTSMRSDESTLRMGEPDGSETHPNGRGWLALGTAVLVAVFGGVAAFSLSGDGDGQGVVRSGEALPKTESTETHGTTGEVLDEILLPVSEPLGPTELSEFTSETGSSSENAGGSSSGGPSSGGSSSGGPSSGGYSSGGYSSGGGTSTGGPMPPKPDDKPTASPRPVKRSGTSSDKVLETRLRRKIKTKCKIELAGRRVTVSFMVTATGEVELPTSSLKGSAGECAKRNVMGTRFRSRKKNSFIKIDVE